MRLLDTNVRSFTQASFQIPQMTNSWGCMIRVLDYALVTGSISQPILAIKTVEDVLNPEKYWVSALLLNPGHSFVKDLSVVRLSGCSDSAYNTDHRVQEVDGDMIYIAFDKTQVPLKPLDSLPSEEINIQLAPLGFKKVFEGENKAVYKSSNPNNNDCYLRVDNSCPVGYDPVWTKFSRVSMYSEMNSIDDYHPRPGRHKVPFYPEDPLRAEEQSGSGSIGIYGESKWYYSTNAASNAMEAQGASSSGPFTFDILGDDKTFYFTPSMRGYGQTWQRVGYCFGEYIKQSARGSSDLNHILCCHEAYKLANTTDLFSYGANPGKIENGSAFGRANYSVGKYMMDSFFDGSLLNKHIKASFTSILPGSISGIDTGLSFNQFQTDLNFVEVFIKWYPLILPLRTVALG